jgi:uncharacterized protein YoxC
LLSGTRFGTINRKQTKSAFFMDQEQKNTNQNINNLEKLSIKLTDWVGTPTSILVHTLLFIGIFSLHWIGLSTDSILLILTTAVSLEAIYLAIFIQMTVNRNTKSLQEVEADIDEIQEDVEDLEEDIDEIQEDVEEIQEDDKEGDLEYQKTKSALEGIEVHLRQLLSDIDNIKKENKSVHEKNN